MIKQSSLSTTLAGDLPTQPHGAVRCCGLPRMHCFVVGLSLVLTASAWWLSTRALEQRNTQRFGRQVDKVIGQFIEQLQGHAAILAASAGLITASDEVTRDEWRKFAATLDLENQFPALSGIGVAYSVPASNLSDFLARQQKFRPGFTLHPPSDVPRHLPMVHVTPARYASVVEGFDLTAEPTRREAAVRAAELGSAQLTAPVTLSYSGRSGVVMMVPFYRDGPIVPPEARAERFGGVVVAAMQLEKLAAGTLDSALRQIRMRVSDQDVILFDELDGPDKDIDPAPLNTLVREVNVYGRQWLIEIHSTFGFRNDADRLKPLLILAGGLCIDLLLLVLLWHHARSERRLHRAATDLQEQSTELAQSNEKLEKFACVASHDLKSPILGIRTLVEFIEEDLDDYFARQKIVPNPVPDITQNLERVRQQMTRASAMIDAVLDYSQVGKPTEPTENVDTHDLLLEIADTLDVGADRLTFAGDFPVFDTNATRLRQVLANLIGNAFKYHRDASSAKVHVSVERSGACYRFSISDDGPGIEACFHEQIFALHGKAHTDVRHDSTGIGLAIVKESIETMGGTISVDSAPGKGTTFIFDWPAEAPNGSSDDSPTEDSEHRGSGKSHLSVNQRAA